MHADSEGSWSMVGMDAETLITNLEEPTMVLNLQGLHHNVQKKIVIHEFGHALGLEHEHQHSDFWDTVGECFDTEKMIEDPLMAEWAEDTRVRVERDFKKSTLGPEDPPLSEYDSDSIMQNM